MAFITTEEVKEIRNELKSLFPTIKFSVSREHHSVLKVAIIEAPLKFDFEYKTINHYASCADKKHKMILKLIHQVCNRNNFDKSDSMTDYFHVGYYFHMSIGKYDKPFKSTLN